MTPDPRGYKLAWTDAHWSGALEAMVIAYGDSHNANGDNSVRAYNPASDAWTYLSPSNPSAPRPRNGDNGVTFVIPRLNEFVVLPRQGGTDYGRLNILTKAWTYYPTLPTMTAFIAGIDRWNEWFCENTASGWCEALDMGVMFGGAVNGSPSQVVRAIRPQAGAVPYRYEFQPGPGSPVPAARSKMQNNGTVIGTNFYVGGGVYYPNNVETPLRDFWRCSLPGLTFTRRADLPFQLANGQLASDGLRVIAYTMDGAIPKIATFDDATNRWTLLPFPSSEIGRATCAGAWCPPIGAALYTGGTSLWTSAGQSINDPTLAVNRSLTRIPFGVAPPVTVPIFSTVSAQVAA